MTPTEYVTLEKYFTAKFDAIEALFGTRFDALEKRLNERYTAQETAISVANGEMNRRLESMNEFRGQLKDQVATFVTKEMFDARNLRHSEEHRLLNDKLLSGLSVEVYNAQHNDLSGKIRVLEDYKKIQEGAKLRGHTFSFVAVTISLLALIMSIVFHYSPITK